MTTFGTYNSLAFSTGPSGYGSCLAPQHLEVYQIDIFTQGTNAINSSSLSTIAKNYALDVLTAIGNASGSFTAPVSEGTQTFTSGSASGTLTILQDDTTPPMGYCKTYDVSYTITVTEPVTVTVLTNPTSTGTVTGGGTYFIGNTPTISCDPTSTGYTFSYWSAIAGTVVDIYNSTTTLSPLNGNLTVTAVLVPIVTLTPTPTPTPTTTTPTPTPTPTPTLTTLFPTIQVLVNGVVVTDNSTIVLNSGTVANVTLNGYSSQNILQAVSLDTSITGTGSWTAGVMYKEFNPTVTSGSAVSTIGTHTGPYTLYIRALASDNTPPSGNTSGYTTIRINWLPPGKLAIYSPWVVSLTNTPVWVESIYPISNGVTEYGVTWGDNGLNQITYKVLPSTENFLLNTYKTPALGTTFYTVTANAINGVAAASRNLYRGNGLSGLYIKDTIPTYNINNYFDPITEVPTLPYTLDETKIGSNEWAISDVVNASFIKLYNNFDYIRNISKVLNLNNKLNLIEWAAQLKADINTVTTNNTSAFAWHTNIVGLNDDNSFGSVSATGIADGTIKDIKSYSFTTSTAPDYYNYIAYSASPGIPDHIQIRTNDWRNTLVLSATSLGANLPSFNSISAIDVINNQLFILDTNTIYKADLVVTNVLSTSNLKSLQKIGGTIIGTRSDKNNFNTPVEIKACNNLLYVCDSLNSCVKVYNSALSWINTVYIDQLRSYTTERVEVNPINNNVYVLAKTFAPVAPILTNVSTLTAVKSVSVVSVPDVNVYSISWTHDGARLIDNTTNSLSAFTLYGLIKGGQSYTMLTSAALVSSNMVILGGSAAGQTQTVTYAAASGVTYTNFAVKALGNNNFNSDLSNVTPTPGSYYFSSPYKVFEIDSNNNLVNSFALPSNTKHISPAGNIQSTTVIKKMVNDPSGVFLYFVTSDYIYKYFSNGTALIRVAEPTKDSLGGVELFKSAFIDNRLNFFLATDKRVFKYIDLPNTLNLYNAEAVDPLMIPLSAIKIDSNEFIQDWVYNKSILRLLQNHELLYKAIKGKYNINLDYNGNLVSDLCDGNPFTVIGLSNTDIASPYTVDQNYFVHSNELVTSDVLNRVISNIYKLQLGMLQLVTPVINKQLPSPSTGNTI